MMLRYMSSNLADLCTSKTSVRSPLESRDSLFLIFTQSSKEGRSTETIGTNNGLRKGA